MNTAITAFRRELHRYAEPAWQEIRTTARLGQLLSEMGNDPVHLGPEAVDINAIPPHIALSAQARAEACQRAIAQGADPHWVEKTQGWPGAVVQLETGRPGPVWAFRFDIDALPYPEKQDPHRAACREGYCSETDSVHACGHDGHTAIGLGLAAALLENKHLLTGTVRLLFQPAEEAYCGAASMISKGWLTGVDQFISLHIALSAEGKPLPSHTFASGCSDFMSFTRLDVDFWGKAAHPCGASQLGRNALLAACSACLSLHTIAPHEEGLTRVNVGVLHSGTVTNTIPDHARLELEYRSTTPAGTAYLRERVEQTLAGAAQSYGVTHQIQDYGTSPAAKSSPGLMALAARAAAKVPWFTTIHKEGNVSGSDDAAEMITAVQSQGGQGIYMGLGADTTDPLHGDAFDFDEEVLEASVSLCLEMLHQGRV